MQERSARRERLRWSAAATQRHCLPCLGERRGDGASCCLQLLHQGRAASGPALPGNGAKWGFFFFFFSIKYFVVQKLQDLLEAALHTGMLLGH